GGLGIIIYNRKEGRALGEVTKFLVYNARKRQEGGDAAAQYFERTECVAGVQDARFQQLMPDVIHWLGLKRIDRFVSMSDMKHDALTSQGIEECARAGQTGGLGIIVYNRKEGRALGEVTKFLVYNARKRQAGGDRADTYFHRTECVAGVQDMRFQELMPDVFHWLGVTRIDRWVSMSNMKHDALTAQGIAIGEQVAIPPDLVPEDASVEIAAKKAAGYFAPDGRPSTRQLRRAKGRGLNE
ncbi:MAG: hypothetical protein WB697_20670, partial [Stellaceae bacterium]